MSNSLEDQLFFLSSQSLSGLSLGPDLLSPCYAGHSLVNLPSTICSWFGAPPLGMGSLASELTSRFKPRYQKVVLFLIDGMGQNFLNQFLEGGSLVGKSPVWRNIATQGEVDLLTSTCPSTTSTALTSLWTGQSPSAHGVIGYEMWLKEFGMVANMVNHSPSAFGSDPGSLRRAGFRSEYFLPVPTLGSHLALNGVRTHAFLHHTLTHSGLSSMLMEETIKYPYLTQADLWVSLGDLLENWRDEKLYVNVYWSDFDLLQHRFTSSDRRTENEFVQFSRQLEDFWEGLSRESRRETLFLFCADHGQIPTPPDPNRVLANYPRFNSWLTIQPTCENRLAMLYLRPGAEAPIREYVHSAWGDDFQLVSSQAALESGLFGSGERHPLILDRIGDLVSIAHNGAFWWWSSRENHQRSRHGGLSHDEMLVPLLICES
jgi:hypothetical protein